MNKLRVYSMGSKVQGVHLAGDPSRPEPESFRVQLSDWGDVDIVRCGDGSYWVHVRVNKPGEDGSDPHSMAAGTVMDGRVDQTGKHASETTHLAEHLSSPRTYHAAIRVGRTEES